MEVPHQIYRCPISLVLNSRLLLPQVLFKIVGDNIDKNIKPRDMREDRSLHYFHVYGIRDRIDLTAYGDQQPSPEIGSISTETLLPSSHDESAILTNYSILFARVLKKHMPFFKKFGVGLERHIRHKYYEEMSLKSDVVSY